MKAPEATNGLVPPENSHQEQGSCQLPVRLLGTGSYQSDFTLNGARHIRWARAVRIAAPKGYDIAGQLVELNIIQALSAAIGGHSPLGESALDADHNRFQIAPVLPKIVRQVRTHKTLGILAVAGCTQITGTLVNLSTSRQTFGIHKYFQIGIVDRAFGFFVASETFGSSHHFLLIFLNLVRTNTQHIVIQQVHNAEGNGKVKTIQPPGRHGIIQLLDSIILVVEQQIPFVIQNDVGLVVIMNFFCPTSLIPLGFGVMVKKVDCVIRLLPAAWPTSGLYHCVSA